MKRSILIIPFARYSRVNYYTLQFEDETENEEGEIESITDKFFSRYENDPKLSESLIKLHDWIEVIGNEYGAHYGLFREEDRAMALPPKEKKMKLHELVVEDALRLYCYWVSESIVILMDGGLKDKPKESVENCPNLLPKFRFANSISKQIEQAFRESDIIIEGSELVFSKYLTITD